MITVGLVVKKRPNRDGSHPIQLKITKDRKSVRLNTGKTVELNQWNDIEKKVANNHPYQKRLNIYLQKILIEVNKLVIDIEYKSNDFNISYIKTKIHEKGILKIKSTSSASTDSPKKLQTVFELSDEYFKTILLAKNFNRYSGERASINHLKRFLNNKDLSFEELNEIRLKKFKAYLLGTIGVSNRSAINYLITIRTIYNIAIREGIVAQKFYPFGKGKISCRRPDSQKIGLDKHEVRELERVKLDVDSFSNHARNVWLFSFYLAGVRASDTLCLRWSSIKGGRLHYVMNKNSKVGSVLLTDKALAILNNYSSKKNKHNLVFPDLSNVFDFTDKIEVQKKLKYRIRKLNNELRKIGKMLGIEKDITMHIARHSFGTIAGDKISIQRLQQLYRHSSIVTTVNYQKAFLNEDADSALESVLDF